MGYVIFHVIITVLAVIGFIEVMYFIISCFYKKNQSKSVLIIRPKSSEIEYELRSYIAKLKSPTGLKPQKIYCIEEYLTPEAIEIVTFFQKDYECIELTSLERIKKIISKI